MEVVLLVHLADVILVTPEEEGADVVGYLPGSLLAAALAVLQHGEGQ